MEVIKGYKANAINGKAAVALGMFDGVHLGHQAIINEVLNYAKSKKDQGIKTAAITLAQHPRKLTRGQAPKLITDLDARLKLFEELGLDYVLVLDFTEELMQMSAEDYLQKYLLETLNAEFISIGYDHHFGKGRRGTPMMLKDWCETNNCILNIEEAFKYNHELVSSSVIRELIELGDIKKANKLLGHEFLITAEVIKGDQRGRELGFPTANLDLAENIVLPKNGVYYALANIGGNYLKSAVNIGFRPTFKNEKKLSCEAHILNFDQDIYGETIELRFLDKIREEQKFSSKEELMAQIQKDIESVKEQEACLMS